MRHLLDRLTEIAANLRAGIAPTSGDAVVLDTAASRLNYLGGLLAEIEDIEPDDCSDECTYVHDVRNVAGHHRDPIPDFPD